MFDAVELTKCSECRYEPQLEQHPPAHVWPAPWEQVWFQWFCPRCFKQSSWHVDPRTAAVDWNWVNEHMRVGENWEEPKK